MRRYSMSKIFLEATSKDGKSTVKITEDDLARCFNIDSGSVKFAVENDEGDSIVAEPVNCGINMVGEAENKRYSIASVEFYQSNEEKDRKGFTVFIGTGIKNKYSKGRETVEPDYMYAKAFLCERKDGDSSQRILYYDPHLAVPSTDISKNACTVRELY